MHAQSAEVQTEIVQKKLREKIENIVILLALAGEEM